MKTKKIGFAGKIGYGLGDMGCNLLSGAIGSYITMYYTDSVMMGAAFVGTMMLMARFLDGISDIIMGAIIDRTYTKWGKARPWLLLSLIPLIVSVLMLFHVPSSLNEMGKKIYISATYIFNSVICMTAANGAYSTLCTLMSPDSNERTSLAGIRMFFSGLAVLIANSYTVALMTAFGGGQHGFTMMSLIYSAVAFVCILITGLSCKEYHIETKEEQKNTAKIPVGQSINVMFRNKYIVPLAVGFASQWLIIALNGAAAVYFARDVLNDVGMIVTISMLGNIPNLIVLFTGIVPRLAMKYGKRKMLIFGAGMQAIGYLVAAAASTNVPLVLTGMVIKSAAMGFITTLLFAGTADTADYLNLKHKINVAGITNSVTSFGMKVGVGLGSAVLGWALAWGGYSAELANSGAVQSAKTILAERMSFAGIPFVCALIVVICAFFIDVDEKLCKLRAAE